MYRLAVTRLIHSLCHTTVNYGEYASVAIEVWPLRPRNDRAHLGGGVNRAGADIPALNPPALCSGRPSGYLVGAARGTGQLVGAFYGTH
jgi:hypothetical protein